MYRRLPIEMMQSKVLLLSFVWCMTISLRVCAQQDDCTTQYEKVIDKTLQPFSGMRVMDYGVTMVERKTLKRSKENRIKVYSDSAHRYILTDVVQVYVDMDHSIMLVPFSKTIMISFTDLQGKKNLKEPPADFADSLFKWSMTVTSCKDILGQEMYDKQMIVKPKNNHAGFLQSEYWINSKELSIHKVILSYNKGDYERVEYVFYQDNKSLSNEKMNKPVIDLFYNKDGKLLQAYKGYKVTDNRITSSSNK